MSDSDSQKPTSDVALENLMDQGCEEIVYLEELWKLKLKSREMGLNR